MSHAPNAQSAKPHEAAAIYRNDALNAFEAQRSAILQAIADHRMQALGSTETMRAPAQNPPRNHAQNPSEQRNLVALNIVAALKEMVAEEVRTQLLVLLDAASVRERARADTGPAPNDKEAQT